VRWIPGGRSENLEDRRGDSGGGGFGGRHIGIGGMVILLILSLVFKQNLFTLVGGDGGASAPSSAAAPITDPQEEQLVQFVSFVLDDAQATWGKMLPQMGGQYRDAKLVLFRDAVGSACGLAQSATGPFYCPGDEKVYIDLGFYQELKDRFGAPGDFAQAYVLAHEIGHHVQALIGTSGQVHQAQQLHPSQANALSVRLELQADCYAGIWANSTAHRDIMEKGDIEEGLRAAASVGDDRIQRMASGTVNPDAFTHGTSAQRQEWFKRGFDSGNPKSCDAFGDDR
jgi:predicted metalloprotease